jgi:8-oxo-dGTP diphosphatase
MVVPVAPEASPCRDTIIVDVANVMGARADGWWRDRAGAALRLCRQVAALARQGLADSEFPPDSIARDEAEAPGDSSRERMAPDWVLVLEGRARQAADFLQIEAGSCGSPLFLADSDRLVRLVLAAGSGDDAIVEEASGLPGRTIVVTADRDLRRRCTGAGAATVGPGWLLRLLQSRNIRDVD